MSAKFNSNKLATDIKSYRDNYKLTNDELCIVLGITKDILSQILKTKLIPNVLLLNQICIILNRLEGGRNIYSYIKMI